MVILPQTNPLVLLMVLALFNGISIARADDFEIVIDTEGDAFAYEVRNVRSKELVFWAPSSYQPEDTGSREFCVDHTKGAEIEWNGDRSAVAITESNHRFSGSVLLLQQTISGFENVLTLSLQEEIRKATKLDWERSRFHFERWIGQDRAEIHLTGLFFTDKSKQHRNSATMRVVLELHSSGPLVSVERVAEDSP